MTESWDEEDRSLDFLLLEKQLGDGELTLDLESGMAGVNLDLRYQLCALFGTCLASVSSPVKWG